MVPATYGWQGMSHDRAWDQEIRRADELGFDVLWPGTATTAVEAGSNHQPSRNLIFTHKSALDNQPACR
jgi:hypothetical protein